MSTLSPEKIAAVHRLPSMTPKIFQRWLATSDHREDWVLLGADRERDRMLNKELLVQNVATTKKILTTLDITVVIREQPGYPSLLKEIPSPPPLLYVRGNLGVLSRPSLAVVGTRRPTAYGLAVTQELTTAAGRAGITIVSGLAYGIDAAAHIAALRAGTATVAVLGSGVDRIYPFEHQSLAADIIAGGGAIISEFPLGAEPERHHFPQRNRIISGLARGVLLVEAGERSGALITVKFAVDQNREVLAIPGPITSPQSIGPNNWLKLGAKLAARSEDILEIFTSQQTTFAPVRPLTSSDPTEATVLDILHAGPAHIDELCRQSRLDTSVVSATLSLLEIRGHVQHLGGMVYSLIT